MDQPVSISLVGVGGQGILLTSEILAKTAAVAGFDVKKSEVHGMAQRGGSVISQIRYGKRVYSPIIPDGGSDLLAAFERVEALRWRPLLKPEGRAVVSSFNIVPVTVSSGQQAPVEDIDGKLNALYPHLLRVDAQKLAADAGNIRTANLVICGVLSRLLPFEVDAWHTAMRERIPAKLLEVNFKAFGLGILAVQAG